MDTTKEMLRPIQEVIAIYKAGLMEALEKLTKVGYYQSAMDILEKTTQQINSINFIVKEEGE